MRGALGLLVVTACGSRAASPPPEPPSNVGVASPPAGASCADSIIDTTRAVDGPTSYVITTDELVARQIRQRLPEFQLCYIARAKYEPELRGRVTVRFTVQKTGRAVNIHTFGFDADIDQCVCAKLSALTFGSFDRDETVEYAFLFSPGA
jgi:hypothetical protein